MLRAIYLKDLNTDFEVRVKAETRNRLFDSALVAERDITRECEISKYFVGKGMRFSNADADRLH